MLQDGGLTDGERAAFEIAADDPRADDVQRLVRTHLGAARRLYARVGFEECEPFGDYQPSRNSAFMTLVLA